MRGTKRFYIIMIYGIVVGSIAMIIRYQNPDMTEMRLFLTYTREIVIAGVIQAVLFYWFWRNPFN